jgi:hypothetical protein
MVVADVAEKRGTPLSREESARVGTDKFNAVRSEIPAVTHVDYCAPPADRSFRCLTGAEIEVLVVGLSAPEGATGSAVKLDYRDVLDRD